MLTSSPTLCVPQHWTNPRAGVGVQSIAEILPIVLANLLFFSVLEGRLVPHAGLILILLCITVPVTSLLLARVELFRQRVAGREDTPPPLVPSREHEAVPPPA